MKLIKIPNDLLKITDVGYIIGDQLDLIISSQPFSQVNEGLHNPLVILYNLYNESILTLGEIYETSKSF